MGLFSVNYSKPGPGVDKDAPQKKGIFRYFEIFFRKFWKLLQVNMLYFLCSLPMLVIFYFLAPVSDSFITRMGIDGESAMTVHLMLRIFFATAMFILWGSGPATAGYAYITRCFTREQHAWIFSDFKDKFKENFKQGIIVAIVDVVVLALIINGLYFYYQTYKSTGSQLWLIACCLLFTLMCVYTFMHYYIYQFMVTFSSSLRQLYKNALIFSLVQLPGSVMLTILVLVLNFVLFNFITPIFVLIIDFIIGCSLMRFPIEYCAARAIEKKLLPNVQSSNTVIEYESEEGEE